MARAVCQESSMRRRLKKLTLNAQTVRVLSAAELEPVHGGDLTEHCQTRIEESCTRAKSCESCGVACPELPNY